MKPVGLKQREIKFGRKSPIVAPLTTLRNQHCSGNTQTTYGLIEKTFEYLLL